MYRSAPAVDNLFGPAALSPVLTDPVDAFVNAHGTELPQPSPVQEAVGPQLASLPPSTPMSSVSPARGVTGRVRAPHPPSRLCVLVGYVPSPADRPLKMINPKTGDEIERPFSENGAGVGIRLEDDCGSVCRPHHDVPRHVAAC